MSGKRLRLLLPAIIIVMLVVGLGVTMLILSVPSPRIEAADVFQDDVYVEDSDAGGTVSVGTVLYNERGDVVRRSVPEEYFYPYDIVDPVTQESVKTYSIDVGFDCWGNNIDWSTFVLSGTWTYTAYIGVTEFGDAWQKSQNQQLATASVSNPAYETSGGQEIVNGLVEFPDIDITTLMPDTIVYVERYKEDLDGDGILDNVVVTHTWDQKTSWSHTFSFLFDVDFSLTVNDDWGNTYDSSYNAHIVLELLWDGSEFGVDWNPDPDETATETVEPPPADPDDPPPVPDETIPPKDDPGDPVKDLDSKESIYLTNTGTDDALVAAFTGAVGSMILVAGVLLVTVPMVVYWYSRRR